MEKIVILCVDDEPNVLNSLKIDLRRSLGPSYLVETAESGQETLGLLTELLEEGYEIAVVIVDYIMPGMKGDELLKQVHAQVPNAINIMLSGQADIDAVARSIEHARLYRFMAKPWRSEDLTLTTQKALQSYKSDRELELKTAEVHQLNNELKRINQSLENTVNERTLQLQATVKELQVLSQLKDDFLHAVSHDLRTPVAGMLMIFRRLQHKVPADPPRISPCPCLANSSIVSFKAANASSNC
jgi:two-component system, sensor histidine kinase and response regulator